MSSNTGSVEAGDTRFSGILDARKNPLGDSLELLFERLMHGEKVEFRCQQVTQGLISSNVMQMKKMIIGINGEIAVCEIDSKLEDQTGKVNMRVSFHSILQVIYGRLSLKDPYKLTLILDGPSLRLKAFNEIHEEFCFQDQAQLFQLIKIIEFIAEQQAKKFPKDEA